MEDRALVRTGAVSFGGEALSKEESDYMRDKTCRVTTIGLAVFLGIIFVLLCVIFGLMWPPLNRYSCFNGDTLGSQEQMWCSPEKELDVRVIRQTPSSVSLYRFKKDDLPQVFTREEHVTVLERVTRYHFAEHPMALVNDSKIVAELESDTADDEWYLFDDDDFQNFIDGEPHKGLVESKGKMSLKYTVKSPSVYHIVVYHKDENTSDIAMSINVTYRLYDLSSTKQKQLCSGKENCIVKNVDPSEVIVAQNNEKKSLDVEFIPQEIDSGTAFFYVFFPLVLVLAIVGLILFPCLMGYWKTFKKKLPGGESKPLKEMRSTSAVTSPDTEDASL